LLVGVELAEQASSVALLGVELAEQASSVALLGGVGHSTALHQLLEAAFEQPATTIDELGAASR
jgi:hypothetical protein